MMNWIITALLWVAPAYIANMSPVFAYKFNLFGLRRPIDGGRDAWDGRRLLGNGKTWQGFFAGIIGGAITGYFLSFIGFGSLKLGAILGFGAVFGDLAGSFAKRRMGLKRGANAGLLDSMDFIVFALLFSAPFMVWEPRQAIFLLIINPILHRSANIIGYKLKLKDVPW